MQMPLKLHIHYLQKIYLQLSFDRLVLDKHGNATRDTTDGICKVSEVKFEFNVGFNKHGKPGNKMPTRFHNINRCEA